MTKPFIVFTAEDAQHILEIYHRTGDWAKVAAGMNAILNERGTRMVWSQYFGWAKSPRTDLRPEWVNEALLLGQRSIEK